MALPPGFLSRPIAHRALHDTAEARPENSLPAIRAAVAAGYGIEIDLQLSRDAQAVVFHDYDLSRLTGATGAVAQRDASELGDIRLTHGGDARIPTLEAALGAVAGKVPLLIELKDQSGGLGPTDGRLEQATARALHEYRGDVAVMSFNPHMVARMARLCPGIPRGLTTDAFAPSDWPTIPQARLETLRQIPDYGSTGACFISHNWRDLTRPRVAELTAQGAALLCWTIRSARDEATARTHAQNITFEGYRA